MVGSGRIREIGGVLLAVTEVVAEPLIPEVAEELFVQEFSETTYDGTGFETVT